MRAYIIDNGSYYVEAIKDLLPSIFTEVEVVNDLDLESIKANSLLILSGGHITPILRHSDAYTNEIKIIQEYQGPIIGICLGSELIAHVYGAHLHSMPINRKGIFKIRSGMIENSVVRAGEVFEVFENHHLSVQKVASPLVSIAESDDGVEIFRHSSKPIFGMQFHPEVDLAASQGNLLFARIVRDTIANSQNN